MFEDADPQSRPVPKVAPWTHEKLKGGGTFKAWKAGACRWVWVHFKSVVSKPCHSAISKGALECPHCGGKPTEMIGYLPLYTDNGKPVVVICRDYSREVVDPIPVFDPVVVSRGKAQWCAMEVQAQQWASRAFASNDPTRKRAADIRPWLVYTLWQQRALVDYFLKMEATKPVVEVETPAPAPDRTPEDRAQRRREGKAEMEAGAKLLKNRIKVVPPVEPLPAQLADAFPNLAKLAGGKPSSNGKRKPGE